MFAYRKKQFKYQITNYFIFILRGEFLGRAREHGIEHKHRTNTFCHIVVCRKNTCNQRKDMSSSNNVHSDSK